MFSQLPVKITHIASCLPKNQVKNDLRVNENEKTEAAAILKTTGIEKVHLAAEETAADLCIEAAKKILDHHPELQHEIGAVVFVSQTPNFGMPASSYYCHEQLGFKNDVLCFDLPYGCSGYLYGLLQSGLILKANSDKKVLLLAGETNSKMTDKSNLQTRLIFGDAGTATIVEFNNNSHSPFLLKNEFDKNNMIFRNYGGFYSNTDMGSPTLHMEGLEVFKFSITKVPALISELLNKAEIPIGEISMFALHQANKFIINYLAKALKINQDKAPTALEETGNTGPASIPLMLSKIGNNYKPLDKVCLVGFGVGLSWGASILNLSETKFISPSFYGSK